MDAAESRLEASNFRGAVSQLTYAFSNMHFAESEDDFRRLEDLLARVDAAGDERWSKKVRPMMPVVREQLELFLNPPAMSVRGVQKYRATLKDLAEGGPVVSECVLLGGYGYELSNGLTYDVIFGDAIAVTAAALYPNALTVPFEQVTAIEIAGPGAVTSGGGFIGGGFGFQGAGAGMAIATLLNTLTTRTEISTVLGIQWDAGEVIFHHSVDTPKTLRLRLSPVLGRLRSQQTQRSTGDSDAVDQLERLGSLFQRGLLTSQEFAAAKKDLLGH